MCDFSISLGIETKDSISLAMIICMQQVLLKIHEKKSNCTNANDIPGKYSKP